jgi:hypothetical protein
MIAILDLIDQNPYSRIDNSTRIDIMNEVILKTTDLIHQEEESSSSSNKDKKKSVNTEKSKKKKS